MLTLSIFSSFDKSTFFLAHGIIFYVHIRLNHLYKIIYYIRRMHICNFSNSVNLCSPIHDDKVFLLPFTMSLSSWLMLNVGGSFYLDCQWSSSGIYAHSPSHVCGLNWVTCFEYTDYCQHNEMLLLIADIKRPWFPYFLPSFDVSLAQPWMASSLQPISNWIQ